MKQDWALREYKKGDEKAILELFKIVFKSDMSLDHWNWQYQNNPAGESFIVVAEANGKIIGHFALLSRLMKIGNKRIRGALSVDTMVHPDFRGKKIHIALGKMACELAKKNGIQLIYGFSNGMSHHNATKELGFFGIYSDGIPLWVKPLNISNIISKRFITVQFLAKLIGSITKLGLAILFPQKTIRSSCSIHEITGIDTRTDKLWNIFAEHCHITVIRDSTYLNWRYFIQPQKSYTLIAAEKGEELVGIVALRCIEQLGLKIGFIVDIMSYPGIPEAAESLLSSSVSFFKASKMDITGCMMLPGSQYTKALKRSGFIKTPRWLLPQKMFLDVNPVNSEHPASFFLEPDNWYVTWSDHDTV